MLDAINLLLENVLNGEYAQRLADIIYVIDFDFKTFSSSRLIASSIVTDGKFNKTLKTSARIQIIWAVFEKKTYHKACKFIQAHTGIVYFVVNYVFFVYLWCISWDVCFSVILAANLM